MKRLLLAIAIGALGARGAGATVGGPELARVLGWDPKLARAYVEIVHTDDAEYTPTIWYFDLRDPSPATPRRLEWSGAEEDELHAKRLAALRKTLRPLSAGEAVGSVLESGLGAPAPFDSVESDDGHRRRYVATLRPDGAAGAALRVLTLDPGRHAVRLLREYAIPGSKSRLLVLSCEAVPMEEGYEVQFPVIAGAGPGTADPLDPQAFNVRR